MTEKKFIVIDDGFVKYIEDTTLIEDKHEGHINDAYELCKELNRLYEENQQLKAQLRKGEDVCDICKYQYLIETSIDRYFMAKCKKEHDECSRGTVNYCDDFEYKGE